jgi:glycosyltransferase involved in cell wall biosynthesis
VRLLLVNWQDREHPEAGGAEIHLHEVFERIAARGHRVTLLCCGWAGAPQRGERGGIEIHRVGTRHTFPLLARRYYRSVLAARGDDILVEDINKIPLYTPWWGAARVMALVPHLFGGTVFREASIPIATTVWLAERPLSIVYRHTPFEAISDSTADDLAARGIPRGQVRVIYPGVYADRYTPAPEARDPEPLFVYLGRLKRYKGVDIVIRAFARLEHPTARLHIAGTGDHRPALEHLVESLDLRARVSFLGFITEADKLALLRRAWALAFASPKEGWGMTNLEAAACGTPVVASDAPGLRESVVDGETGLLVPHGNVPAMAGAFGRLASNLPLVRSMGQRGRRFAEGFTWDRAAQETERHLNELIATRTARS